MKKVIRINDLYNTYVIQTKDIWYIATQDRDVEGLSLTSYCEHYSIVIYFRDSKDTLQLHYSKDKTQRDTDLDYIQSVLEDSVLEEQ